MLFCLKVQAPNYFVKMSIKICIAGATGWAGSALSNGVLKEPDITLVSGISRSNAGNNLADILDVTTPEIPVLKILKKLWKDLLLMFFLNLLNQQLPNTMLYRL